VQLFQAAGGRMKKHAKPFLIAKDVQLHPARGPITAKVGDDPDLYSPVLPNEELFGSIEDLSKGQQVIGYCIIDGVTHPVFVRFLHLLKFALQVEDSQWYFQIPKKTNTFEELASYFRAKLFILPHLYRWKKRH
jgi:hypothetical protein